MNSNTFLTSYQRIEGNDDYERDEDELSVDPLIHIVPNSDKTRWNHIEDLDSFFTRVYQYHQEYGFQCMITQEIGDILRFIFTILFSLFMLIGINYQILFKNKPPPNKTQVDKVTLADCILSPSEAWQNMNVFIFIILIVISLYIIGKIFYAFVNYFRFKEIQKFYNVALGIEDENIENVTWEEVQHRLMEVQVEQRMCIHKESLTELDIYHRILRFDNYFIAMVNKGVIPLKLNAPCIGEFIFLTEGLRYSLNKILFSSYFAPFKNWHLKDEYKRAENRHQLAEALKRVIFWGGILNLIFFPFIMLCLILRVFYHYTPKLKNEPGVLSLRRWSCYAEISLRHYNELDHELRARLNRGYRCAVQYMNSFSSPLLAILATNVLYVFGAIFAVVMALTYIDEDVMQVEYVFPIASTSIALVGIMTVFIRQENLVWCPEILMKKVLGEVHYLPDSWKGKAHTTRVRKEFSNYFQYSFVCIIESLLSPMLTGYFLIFILRPKALEIVDFLRNFTVEVIGVGDICSFAQMDIKRHGSRTWHPRLSNIASTEDHQGALTDHGKTELSLLHFTLTNPNWKLPQDSATFINAIKTQARREYIQLSALQENALPLSTSCLGDIGDVNAAFMQSRWMGNQGRMSESVYGKVSHHEGSRHGPSNGILGSLSQSTGGAEAGFSGQLSPQRKSGNHLTPFVYNQQQPQDMIAVDMSVSTLFLHELHQRRREQENYAENVTITKPPNLLTTPRTLGMPPSSYPESCYNSSDPPSVDDSLNLSASNILPNSSFLQSSSQYLWHQDNLLSETPQDPRT